MPAILEYRGKNNPAAQEVHDVGPLPQGQYTISPVHTIPHLGLSMALTPAPTAVAGPVVTDVILSHHGSPHVASQRRRNLQR